MQLMSAYWQDNITAASRSVKGKVELYNGSTLANTFVANTKLSSIKVERTPTNGAFFGYTISQKATINLLNKDNDIQVTKGQDFKVYLGTEGEYANFPTFTISDFKKDEVKGTIEASGYDLIHTAAEHTFSEINVTLPAGIMDYARAIATFLGTEIVEDFGTTWYYEMMFTEASPPNYEGTESLRDVLEDIAQATGSICFVDSDNKIRFKLLENYSVTDIDKSQYFSLEVGEPISLTKISATTELGDNLGTGDDSGFNQIIHDNPFLEANTDEAIGAIEVALANYVNTVIYPYNIKWRGNPALEIGDCVLVTLKDGKKIALTYLGETIKYTGGMSATSEWKATEQSKVSTTPTNIGEAIKQTYAKVDKVNKQIDMVVSETQANSEEVAALRIETNKMSATVASTEQQIKSASEELSKEINTLTNRVNTAVTAEDVTIAIETELAQGTNKVTTSTGFTFNEEGLSVSKSGSEMETKITEDGMTVSKDNNEVLIANNKGVQAIDLHARTYLIIGTNSRFEDYGSDRTGCFWIG